MNGPSQKRQSRRLAILIASGLQTYQGFIQQHVKFPLVKVGVAHPPPQSCTAFSTLVIIVKSALFVTLFVKHVEEIKLHFIGLHDSLDDFSFHDLRVKRITKAQCVQ